jgi:spermidine/putrescine transport system permease protein
METGRRAVALLTPPVLYLAVFFIVPLCIMATYAFRAGSFGEASHVFTWENFQLYFSTPAFQRLLLRSVGQALLIAILSVMFAYPLSYFLVFKAGKLKVFFLTLLIIPAWTSFLLRILAWKLILGSTGLINSLLLSAGIIQEASPLLLYSRTAVVVTLVYVWIPFAALPIFSALERIDRHLLEASADLGASGFSTFLRITLPLSLPGVIASFFFVFVPTIGEWVTPALVGGARGIMYGNLIQDQFVRALNWPMGSLMSMVMLAVVLLLSFIFTRLTRVSEYAAV